jgi:hypothetical protein
MYSLNIHAQEDFRERERARARASERERDRKRERERGEGEAGEGGGDSWQRTRGRSVPLELKHVMALTKPQHCLN